MTSSYSLGVKNKVYKKVVCAALIMYQKFFGRSLFDIFFVSNWVRRRGDSIGRSTLGFYYVTKGFGLLCFSKL